MGIQVISEECISLTGISCIRESRHCAPRKSMSLVIIPQISHHETKIPSVIVEPGDRIIADGEGVVCVPHQLEQVVKMVESSVQVDAIQSSEPRGASRMRS